MSAAKVAIFRDTAKRFSRFVYFYLYFSFRVLIYVYFYMFLL